MKTCIIMLAIAAFYTTTPDTRAAAHLPVSGIVFEDGATQTAMLIGRGRIKSKNGNTFSIQSDDGNTYLAEVQSSYLVGDDVLHTDPVDGWVEILGLAQ